MAQNFPFKLHIVSQFSQKPLLMVLGPSGGLRKELKAQVRYPIPEAKAFRTLGEKKMNRIWLIVE